MSMIQAGRRVSCDIAMRLAVLTRHYTIVTARHCYVSQCETSATLESSHGGSEWECERNTLNLRAR